MKKKRPLFEPPDLEVPTIPHLPELETLEGYAAFRQQMIDEMIKTFELHSTEGEGLLKIPIKEAHSLLNRLFRETAKFYAQHSSAEFTEWFFKQYYQALGIPFDSNTAKTNQWLSGRSRGRCYSSWGRGLEGVFL
jgi:hypothetical protein